eukprot:Phypoly_transcript_10487.p1 GENE.Phypoly_transcript_10487~~Phypoly_transcript_10487.p1  ORF type:complete len:346 (+),score=47.71 Phypoly_transcript_10487:94-1131(+)
MGLISLMTVKKYQVCLQNNSFEESVKVSVITKIGEIRESVREHVLPPAKFPGSACTLELDYGALVEAHSYSPEMGTRKIPGIYCITRDESIHFYGEESRAMCDIVLQNNTDQELHIENNVNYHELNIAPGDADGVCLPLGTKVFANTPDRSGIQPQMFTIEDHGVIIYTSKFPQLTYPEVRTLYRWFTPSTPFDLIYQGSKDGFEGSTFRSKVHGAGPVIVVVTTTEGYIFGGFAPEGFTTVTEGSTYSSDSTAFTFSLRNHLKSEPAQFRATNSTKECAYVKGSHTHASFGDSEMRINEDGLGGHFSKCTENSMIKSPDPTHFTGSTTFTTKEIEVYHVEIDID